MSMISSRGLIRARNLTRKLGINSFIGKLVADKNYEDKFGKAIQKQIQTGDIVWDVGANLGVYTQRFLQFVGETGRVVAFEPIPDCFSQLNKDLGTSPQVILKNVAMGEEDGVICMAVDNNPLAATHRVVEGSQNSLGSIMEVSIVSAQTVVATEPNLFPNIIKIDVEGHEGSVISGLEKLLQDKRLRCVGVEVHFGLLNERGESNCPQLIQTTFEQNGFNVRWTDFSHMLALR